MNYGLYLSASGVMANVYKQDVVANNLANSETTGFRRDLAMFYERPTEAQSRGGLAQQQTNAMLEHIGGGIAVAPTTIDTSAGDMEQTGNATDVAIQGKGFLGVADGKSIKLTRDGKLMLDRDGNLILASNGKPVLGVDQKPIQIDPTKPVNILDDGHIMQGKDAVAQIGLFDVSDSTQLQPQGGNLLAVSDPNSIIPSQSTLKSQFLEHSNVDPTREMTQLMDTQRQLEANANMIRYQDQMLSELVSSVGKVS